MIDGRIAMSVKQLYILLSLLSALASTHERGVGWGGVGWGGVGWGGVGCGVVGWGGPGLDRCW